MGYSFYLKKENFKFSSAHFTIFSATESEALHGHNYRVGVHLQSSRDSLQNEMICDFNVVKKIIRSTCELLDEKILVPLKSPYLTLNKDDVFKDHCHITYHKKHYVLPLSDVYFMDCENITSEALSFFIAQKIAPALQEDFNKIKVSVEETRGQIASYTQSF